MKVQVSETCFLDLSVPDGWKRQATPADGLGPASVQLVPDENSVVLLTVLPPVTREADVGSLSALEPLLDMQIEKARASSVEQELPVRRLSGANVDGTYFSATDSDPSPTGFRHLTQGIAWAGKRLLNVTILTRDATSTVPKKALEMVRTLELHGGNGASAPNGRDREKPVLASRCPSRVECVRAGWVFTFFWQDLCSPETEPLSQAEMDSIVTPLESVFANPRFDLDMVVMAYRNGSGSNEVLRTAMHGLPDYVLRWFRAGQTLNVLMDGARHLEDIDFDLGEQAVSGNLASAGVAEPDREQLTGTVRALRKASDRNEVVRLIGKLYADLQAIASQQDRYEEFQQKAVRDGGIFISYAHADKDVIERIVSRFDSDGFVYWLDENELLAGQNLEREIDSAIERSCLFLVLLTPSSVESDWVRRELEQALPGVAGGTKLVIPMIAKGLALSSVPEDLHLTVSIHLDPDFDAGYEKVKIAVIEHLKAFATRHSP